MNRKVVRCALFPCSFFQACAGLNEGRRRSICPGTVYPRTGYPWRVALPQSSLPFCRINLSLQAALLRATRVVKATARTAQEEKK